MNICRFTSLDDLPKKLHGSRAAVIEAVKAAGNRFSAFDINTDAMAATMTRLFSDGTFKDVGGNYPWTEVEIKS